MNKENPFKFGTVVDGIYFTNRTKELSAIQQSLNSQNHLILIGPRRFGKTSLVKKVIKAEKRKSVFLDVQLTNSVEDFAAQYLKRIYSIYPLGKIRNILKNFRIVPNINLNPVSNEVEIQFQANLETRPILEDVFNLLEKLSSQKNKPIVVLGEFQDIKRLDKGIDRILRSVMQNHQNINYIFLGSQESMMREIFEKKKSPFYHFAQLMYLKKIDRDHFTTFIEKGFAKVSVNSKEIAQQVLTFTEGHPFYTQQLSYLVWNLLNNKIKKENIVEQAIVENIHIHDLDFERLWLTFNSTDKKTLTRLSTNNRSPLSAKSANKMNIKASSTVFSSLKRLMKSGYVIKTSGFYEIDDPFFREWIVLRRK